MIDVGANAGQTLLDFLYARTPRRYEAIEPNPSAAEIVRKVIEHNHLERCPAHTVALFDTNQERGLFLDPHRKMDTRATTFPTIRPQRRYVEHAVHATTFDSLAEKIDLKSAS